MALALAACGQAPALPPTPANAPASRVVTSSTPTVAPTAWQQLAAGVEVRDLEVPVAGHTVSGTVIRLDPTQIRLRVSYTPGTVQFLDRWADAAPSALVTFNGGYFTPQAVAMGAVVVEGQASGRSLQGYGGMLAATGSGQITVRSLRAQPYRSQERLTAAVQCYPMLVVGGAAPSLNGVNSERARRTVVATNATGQLLVIAITDPISLAETSAWLLAGDLQISQALNLDGGSSTGIALRTPRLRRTVPALSPLPLVVQVLPR